jgi:dihydroorotase
VLIDPDLEWTVDASTFQSRGRSTPFDGWRLTGRAIATFVAGAPTYRLAGTAVESLV